MRYMLMIHADESRWTVAERTACMEESIALGRQLIEAGRYRASAPLESASTAVTVRVVDGEPLVTQGPFAETVEQLGGFYIVDLDNLDEAIALAAQLPPAAHGKATVEIRPLFPLDGLPQDQPIPFGAEGRLDIFLCHDNPADWTDPNVLRAGMDEALGLANELDQAGRYVLASPLRPAETATCVRVEDGKRLVTDGPFAETREVLGGFYIVRSNSIDDALAIAARHPGARGGAVEIRPLFDLSRLGGFACDSAAVVDSHRS